MKHSDPSSTVASWATECLVGMRWTLLCSYMFLPVQKYEIVVSNQSTNALLLVKHFAHMAVCQNPIPLVNIKIAGKWMFIPLKMVCIGIDP